MAFIEIDTMKDKVLIQHAKQGRSYLDLYVSMVEEEAKGLSFEEVESKIKQDAKEKLKTSSNCFLVIYVQNRAVFIRDEATTQRIQLMDSEQYNSLQIAEKKELVKTIENTYLITLKCGEKYLVNVSEIGTATGTLHIGLCTKETEYLEQYNFGNLKIHVTFYLFVICMLCITLSMYMYYKNTKLWKKCNERKEKLIQNRTKIEILETKLLQEPKYIIRNCDSGYIQKDMMEKVLEEMTQEQVQKSIKVFIKVRSGQNTPLLALAICLERTPIDNCIHCFWDKDTLLVLLLNNTQEVADKYIKQVLVCYRAYFDEEVELFEYFIEGRE